MIELTEQQRQELYVPEPIAIDPRTKRTSVLVRQAVYDRLKAVLDLAIERERRDLRLRTARPRGFRPA